MNTYELRKDGKLLATVTKLDSELTVMFYKDCTEEQKEQILDIINTDIRLSKITIE
jgi:hypothetical protein